MKHPIGYCTNVHAGTTLALIKENLSRYAADVRARFCPDRVLPVGLWISDAASRELQSKASVSEFRLWLRDAGFWPYTLNGFPFRDFHQPVVKRDVYLPGWDDPTRLDFTIRLAHILSGMLAGDSTTATISTLPIGWPIGEKNRNGRTLADRFSETDRRRLAAGARHLQTLAGQLYQLAMETGVSVRVCLEPEPGCLLDCADDLVLFFESLLMDQAENRDHVQAHLGVCHDICHSAVMFEPQQLALEAYRDAGIVVGKIQVSAAVEARFASPSGSAGRHPSSEVLKALKGFAEPRYLHQTSIRDHASDANTLPRFFEDLSLALSSTEAPADSTWRVHFHVPIFLRELGALWTTQEDIQRCLRLIPTLGQSVPPQLEVETYAWNVLPGKQEMPSLASGIAEELGWLETQLKTG